jgi:hypothetical protein
VSDTPISDNTPHNVADLGMLCRRIERKLNAANDRIKRLEEVIVNERNKYNLLADDARAVIKAWNKAKEAKP